MNKLLAVVLSIVLLSGCTTPMAEIRVTEYGVGTGLAVEARGVRITESGKFASSIDLRYIGEHVDLTYRASSLLVDVTSGSDARPADSSR